MTKRMTSPITRIHSLTEGLIRTSSFNAFASVGIVSRNAFRWLRLGMVAITTMGSRTVEWRDAEMVENGQG